MCISTHKLRFLDISNFIAPGFSHSKYLAAFDVKQQKGLFPYEFVTSLDQLKIPSLPPQEAFFGSIKNTGISDEDYAYCRQVWEEHSMKTLKDCLTWYNNKDGAPFLLFL